MITIADQMRFLAKVKFRDDECHEWLGAKSRGKQRGHRGQWYGTFKLGGKAIRAHKATIYMFAPEKVAAPGDHHDHTCCFTLCVNTEHLEPCSASENAKRRWKVRD